MRSSKLLTAFSLVLLLACSASAQLLRNPAFLASLKKTTTAGGGGGNLIFQETFDPTGYVNAFSEGGFATTGLDEDFTGWKWAGAQSLNLSNNGNFGFVYLSTAQRVTNWVSFVCVVHQTTGNLKFSLSSFGVADRGYLFIHSGSGSWRLNHGGVESSETVVCGMQTTNFVRLEYVNAEGGAGTGIFNAWVRTNTYVFPGGTPDLSITTGNSTTKPDSFVWQVFNNEAWIIDEASGYDSRPASP